MPRAHLDQWQHNRTFLQSIEPLYPDWAVTAVFYTALHAVDALLTGDKVPGIVSHETRNRALMHTNRYAKIWDRYQPLHDLSRTIRYLAQPGRWVPWERIESDVVRRHLYPIEQSVQKLLNVQLDLPPIALRSPSVPD